MSSHDFLAYEDLKIRWTVCLYSSFSSEEGEQAGWMKEETPAFYAGECQFSTCALSLAVVPSSPHLSQGQGKPESGTLARAALHTNLPLMLCDENPAQIEAQAQTTP